MKFIDRVQALKNTFLCERFTQGTNELATRQENVGERELYRALRPRTGKL